MPTDAYGLDEAVAEGFLVPPRGVSVGTRFLRQGIRYDELSEEEKDDWDALDWGEGGTPTTVDADEVNRFLFNEDTVDKALATLMTRGYKVAGGPAAVANPARMLWTTGTPGRARTKTSGV